MPYAILISLCKKGRHHKADTFRRLAWLGLTLLQGCTFVVYCSSACLPHHRGLVKCSISGYKKEAAISKHGALYFIFSAQHVLDRLYKRVEADCPFPPKQGEYPTAVFSNPLYHRILPLSSVFGASSYADCIRRFMGHQLGSSRRAHPCSAHGCRSWPY